MGEIEKLVSHLKGEDWTMQAYAANKIKKMVEENPDAGWIDSVPTLLDALDAGKTGVQLCATRALESILDNCAKKGKLDDLQEKVHEYYEELKEKNKGRQTSKETNAARYMKDISLKRNSLAPDKGIILDDIPKPPKKGTKIYQQLRAIRNG